MPAIPTRQVRYRSSGALVLINAADFNPELHADPAAPEAAPAAPEPEPEAAPVPEHRPRRRG